MNFSSDEITLIAYKSFKFRRLGFRAIVKFLNGKYYVNIIADYIVSEYGAETMLTFDTEDAAIEYANQKLSDWTFMMNEKFTKES